MSDVLARLCDALADRYTIDRELGQGGMATVYLAEDLKHHRKVAIKVLRPDLSAALGPDRFMQEIEIAARLQHPHILGVHDSGQSDGFLYYVMPYVEGESLRERLSRQGELPIHEAVRLLAEIADALGHAHQRGVVHRDIKPENVMLSGRHALVMDFGVAKAVNEASGRNRLTTLGVALGTPAYMAPEQASADPHLDHRVDIYALGVVGYELLAGRPPFTGASPQQVLAAHVTQASENVTQHRPAISPALGAVIMRALEKRPADRWQTAEEMLHQLEPLATPSGGLTPTATMPVTAVLSAPVKRNIPKWAIAVAGVVLVAAAAFGLSRVIGGGKSSGGGAQSVAVLPFENVAGDSANVAFTDGVQSEILTDLTRLADLQVTSRNSVQEYRASKKPVKQIGAELGVRSLLSGQVQRAGNQVHVTVQLVDAGSDRQIWAASYDRELTAQNIFTIQGDIASNVAQALKASFTTTQAATAEKPPTNNLEALDWYHRGWSLYEDRSGVNNERSSTGAFEQAVALDSGFAAAWAGLAAGRAWEVRNGQTTDTLPAYRALARATALAPATPETELARAYYEYYARGDFDAALGHFRSVATARPNDVEAIAGVGLIARRQGRWAEALDAETKLTTLDPRNVPDIYDLGVTHLAIRQYVKAAEVLRRALIIDPASNGANAYLMQTLTYGTGDTAAARGVLAAMPTSVTVGTREFARGGLEREARHFDLSDTAFILAPNTRPIDRPFQLVTLALNDFAAGALGRARARADTTQRLVQSLLGQSPATDAFGNQALLHSLMGLAEAIQGHATEAVRDGDEALRAYPPGKYPLDGARSFDALIVIHLILGHRDDAIHLIAEQAQRPYQVQSWIPTTRASILLDPIFDSVRDDPRIRALLKDDAAWVVR